MRYRSGVINMDVINMEVKIKQGNEMLDATIEMVDGVMVVSPKELFEPEDGDIVATKDGSHIFLCKDYIGEEYIYAYLGYDFNTDCWFKKDTWCASRYATEEEKKKFFDRMKEEGWEWDAEKKELVKLKWKPKDNDNYWSPSLFDSEFIPWKNSWQNSKIGNKRLEKGWVFRTDKECQEFCNRLNEAINSVKP